MTEASDLWQSRSSRWRTATFVLFRPQKGKWCDQKRLFSSSRTDDIFDIPTRVNRLSTSNLKSGYWQVALHSDNKEETGFFFFIVQWPWPFTVIPFGFCNVQLRLNCWWRLSYGPRVQTLSGVYGSSFPWPDIPGTAWTPPDSVSEVRQSSPHT